MPKEEILESNGQLRSEAIKWYAPSGTIPNDRYKQSTHFRLARQGNTSKCEKERPAPKARWADDSAQADTPLAFLSKVLTRLGQDRKELLTAYA